MAPAHRRRRRAGAEPRCHHRVRGDASWLPFANNLCLIGTRSWSAAGTIRNDFADSPRLTWSFARSGGGDESEFRRALYEHVQALGAEVPGPRDWACRTAPFTNCYSLRLRTTAATQVAIADGQNRLSQVRGFPEVVAF
jgi:hypothetical protein